MDLGSINADIPEVMLDGRVQVVHRGLVVLSNFEFQMAVSALGSLFYILERIISQIRLSFIKSNLTSVKEASLSSRQPLPSATCNDLLLSRKIAYLTADKWKDESSLPSTLKRTAKRHFSGLLTMS